MPSETSEQLEKRRSELKERLVELGDMRPGSLVERYRRCGKPACHCASRDAAGHGPSWSLTRGVAGKTVTKIIPPTAVEQTRRQIDEYHRFRLLIREFVEVSEAVCDARLQGSGAASGLEAAQKGGSKRPSKRKSSPRLKL
jgi:hypothetical protein